MTSNIVAKFLLLIIFFNECLSQRSQICESNDNQDCSFQLPSAEQRSCQIYNTSVCMNDMFHFSKSSNELSLESDAKFAVSVFPYSVVIYELQRAFPLSAINITFTMNHQDIKGFSVEMREDLLNKTLCRILDFKDYSKEIAIPTTFFYDCFYNLVESNIQHVRMTFKSLPAADELSYYVSIPATMTYGKDSTCYWQILIMVFCGSLSKGVVVVKFSPAPELKNITSYSVKLSRETSNKVYKTLHTNYTMEDSMMTVEFSGVEEGSYYVSVTPENWTDRNCLPAKTALFLVASKSFDKIAILMICLVIVVIISSLSLLRCLQTYTHPELPHKQVLLVHSYDCLAHDTFVSSFAAYLTNMCKVNVSTIYGKTQNPENWIASKNKDPNTKDPEQWIRDKYKEADAIIFLISEGLYLTLAENGNPENEEIQLKEGSHWRKQPLKTQAYISLRIFNPDNDSRKKFCKVYFPYSTKKHIPECLSDLGPCYKLPKQLNQFLCFIFECKPIIPYSHAYPKLCGSQSLSSDLGREMFEKMKAVQDAVKRNVHVTKIQKTRIASNKSKVHRCSVGSDSISALSLVDVPLRPSHSYDLIPDGNIQIHNELEEDFNCSDTSYLFLEEFVNYAKQVQFSCKDSSPNDYRTLLVKDQFV